MKRCSIPGVWCIVLICLSSGGKAAWGNGPLSLGPLPDRVCSANLLALHWVNFTTLTPTRVDESLDVVSEGLVLDPALEAVNDDLRQQMAERSDDMLGKFVVWHEKVRVADVRGLIVGVHHVPALVGDAPTPTSIAETPPIHAWMVVKIDQEADPMEAMRAIGVDPREEGAVDLGFGWWTLPRFAPEAAERSEEIAAWVDELRKDFGTAAVGFGYRLQPVHQLIEQIDRPAAVSPEVEAAFNALREVRGTLWLDDRPKLDITATFANADAAADARGRILTAVRGSGPMVQRLLAGRLWPVSIPAAERLIGAVATPVQTDQRLLWMFFTPSFHDLGGVSGALAPLVAAVVIRAALEVSRQSAR